MNSKNKPNRKKLLHSKWTATKPQNKEKHFTVTHVKIDEENDQVIEFIVLKSAFTDKEYKIDYKVLEDELNWKQGWK